MSRNFTLFKAGLITAMPILFITFFSCSKNQGHSSRIDSTANGVYLDPGQITAVIQKDTFRSFSRIQAYDVNSQFSITGQAILGGDTAFLQLTFPDSLRTQLAYTDYLDSANKWQPLFTVSYWDQRGTGYGFSLFEPFLDTLTITSLNRATHQITGTFAGRMTSLSTGDSGPIVQVSLGSFNTYFN